LDDLDSLPLPDSQMWPMPASAGKGILLPVQTRRGCPMACGYCSTSRIEGRITRRRNPFLVARWLKEWEAAGVRQFFFVDNTFNLPPTYAKELCRAIIQEKPKISWQSIIYPRLVDEELAALMAQAGCSQISLGFGDGEGDKGGADLSRYQTGRNCPPGEGDRGGGRFTAAPLLPGRRGARLAG